MPSNSLLKRLPDKRILFKVPPSMHGGQEVTIETDVYIDSTGDIAISQEIRLNSHGNSASINLGVNALSPAALRSLADQIEEAEEELKE